MVVIDDEPSVLRLISRFAAELPLDVVQCTSFEEAWEAIQTAAIVVCDVHLEGMTGQEIVQTIHANGLNAKVLMISGDTRRNNVEDCITLGINDFLAKPFSRELLVAKIRRLLVEDSPSEVGSEN
jgi:DNA-binding response OmpR family regulator